MGIRSAIGETNFEQAQILGYAPIEPDGSFKLHVPADTAILLSVVDSSGRSFQTHPNWIQVRPGERRTCDGCQPRRGGAINSGAVVNALPTGMKAAMTASHQSARRWPRCARGDPTLKSDDPVFTDVWADTTQAGVSAKPSISLKYRGNPNPADDLPAELTAPVNGIINYPQHIAPIWTTAAPTPAPPAKQPGHLDQQHHRRHRARAVVRGADAGRPADRRQRPAGVPARGRRARDLQRGPSYVNTSSNDANTAGQARKTGSPKCCGARC